MKQLFTYLFFISVIWACKKDSSAPVNPPDDVSSNVHLTLGNPSNALADGSDLTNYLLVKTQYVSSYNSRTGKPNWTAWHLDRLDIGSAERKDDFRPDDSLPESFYHVKPSDYTSADGFDRGHMCPSADRTIDQVSNSTTFLMTNIAPQAPELNRGLWEEFEAYCREQAYNGNELYIYTGSYGIGGIGANGQKTTMASGNVLVPARFYKVVLILPFGNGDVSRITENTSVIAIDVPNSQAVNGKDWDDYATTVYDIEKAANISFWSKINALIASKLKQKKYGPAITTPVSSTSTPPASATSTPTTPISTTSTSTTPTTPSSCGYHNGKKLYKGPEGGCYYINSKGNKTYVDRSECTC